MNLDALLRILLAAARLVPPSERVPYAFEQRIMARLRARSPLDAWTLWGRALWRAAVSCLVVMLLASLWTFWAAQTAGYRTDFVHEFENAVFVMVEPTDYSP